MSEKILSISIAAYNVENVIKKCLDSLCECRYFDKLDIIVVDDGSSDQTVDLVTYYVQKFPNIITLIAKENGGHGSTINASLKVAKGKYYKVLDGDDWVNPNALDQLVTYLENADVDLVINPYNEVYNDRISLINVRRNLKFNTLYTINDLSEFDYMPMHSICVKLEQYKKVNQSISEHCFYVDTEFVYFIFSIIDSVVFLEDVVYQYRLDQPTQSVSWNGIYKHIEDYICILKRLFKLYNDTHYTNGYRQNLLFRLLSSRYKLLFYWYSNFTNTDKDYLLIDIDKDLRKLYPQLLASINLGVYSLLRIRYKLGLLFIRLLRRLLRRL